MERTNYFDLFAPLALSLSLSSFSILHSSASSFIKFHRLEELAERMERNRQRQSYELAGEPRLRAPLRSPVAQQQWTSGCCELRTNNKLPLLKEALLFQRHTKRRKWAATNAEAMDGRQRQQFPAKQWFVLSSSLAWTGNTAVVRQVNWTELNWAEPNRTELHWTPHASLQAPPISFFLFSFSRSLQRSGKVVVAGSSWSWSWSWKKKSKTKNSSFSQSSSGRKYILSLVVVCCIRQTTDLEPLVVVVLLTKRFFLSPS